MLDFFRNLSGPITLHLELTEACPERCRHCYNFIREQNYHPNSIEKEDIDRILDDFKAIGGFHVILTGGEPLVVFDKLLYAVQGVRSRELSLSVNSNLIPAKPAKMAALKKAGVDHILTTVFSHNPDTHDYIASRKGVHAKVIKGIKVTRNAGIRVSVNMIVTNVNDKDVYETGKMLHSMGLEKFIANRMIPSTSNSNTLKKEFLIHESTARGMIDSLLALKKDLGMTVSTCRALPHCFLGDITGHFPFIARGCNAGKRHLLLGCDGKARACVHEAKGYGNIHDIGIKGIWDNMEQWRRKDLLPTMCQQCPLVGICEGACRQIAKVVHGDWSGKDNLCKGPEAIRPYYGGGMPDLVDRVRRVKLFVNPKLEFRKENDFYLVRIFGGKCVLIENKFAEFLIAKQKKKALIKMKEFPDQNHDEFELYLLYDMIRPKNFEPSFAGLMEQYKK